MILKQAYYTEEQIAFLDGLDGLSFSENARKAIQEFIEKRKTTASASESKRREAKNG